MISLILLEKPLEKLTKVYCQLYSFMPIQYWDLLLQVNQDWIFSHENTFWHTQLNTNTNKRQTQMNTTQYPELFVTYPEAFNMNTGNKNPIVVDEGLWFSQQSKSLPLLFDSVSIKFWCSPLIDSFCFGTVDCDAHINTKKNIPSIL